MSVVRSGNPMLGTGVLLGLACWLYCAAPAAGTLVIEIEIKDHLFYPQEITIPVNTKVKLLIDNRDSTPEEFESYELNREKVIEADSKAVIFIGPLPAGSYPFFGEFHPRTARGRVMARD